MQRLDVLIRDVRDQTGNQQYSATQGIRQREFVRHANDAQMRIYNLLLQEHSSLYMKESFISSVAGTQVYTLPTDIFLKHNVLKVDYSYNGDARGYNPLEMRTPREQVSAPGYPDSYFLRQGTMVVSPIPTNSTTNAFRLNYQYTIPTLDIRRALISQYNFVSADSTYATYDLVLSGATDETISDLTNGWVNEFSVEYRDLIAASPSTSLTAGTGLLMISFTPATLTLRVRQPLSADDSNSTYLLFGTNAVTQSQLPDVAERYLREYMATRIQMRDSNSEANDTSQVLVALEQEILASIADLEEDISAIPIIDNSMLNYDQDL